ncbi:MAG: glycosyltransferase family 2 protein [Desulfosoma sp.]
MFVSVIVPFFNAEKFLDDSIGSVLEQTYTDIELILVDDGSTDGSLALCRKYGARDSRIRIIAQPNQGPASARNTGVRMARGDLVFFLDADDLLRPQALEKLLFACKEHQPDLVLSNFCKLMPNGKFADQKVTLAPGSPPCQSAQEVLGPYQIRQFVRHFLHSPSNHLISYCWARLYKACVIRQHRIIANEDMRLFEDFVFNLDYIKNIKSLFLINEPLYVYRMHDHHISLSMSMLNAPRLIRDMEIFRKAANDFLTTYAVGDGLETNPEQEIGHALTHYAIIFLVRSCRLLAPETLKFLYRQVGILLKAPIMQWSLRGYRPRQGNSRLLPLFINHQWILPTLILSMVKGYARYGKPSSGLRQGRKGAPHP